MNEFKKTTMLIKGGKAPFYIGFVILIANQISAWFCATYPTLIKAASRIDVPGVFSIFGVDKIDETTLPTVLAVVLSTVVAMAINWWKRVGWGAVSGAYSKLIKVEK